VSKRDRAVPFLPQSIILAFRAVLPRGMAEELQQRIADAEVAVPSATTLHRHKLAFHVGWLLPQRRQSLHLQAGLETVYYLTVGSWPSRRSRLGMSLVVVHGAC